MKLDFPCSLERNGRPCGFPHLLTCEKEYLPFGGGRLKSQHTMCYAFSFPLPHWLTMIQSVHSADLCDRLRTYKMEPPDSPVPGWTEHEQEIHLVMFKLLEFRVLLVTMLLVSHPAPRGEALNFPQLHPIWEVPCEDCVIGVCKMLRVVVSGTGKELSNCFTHSLSLAEIMSHEKE